MYDSSLIIHLAVCFGLFVSDIMAEYQDCVSRSQRLAAARESYLAGNSNSVMVVRAEDLFIYLRSLVCNFAAVRKFQQYAKVYIFFLLFSFFSVFFYHHIRVTWITGLFGEWTRKNEAELSKKKSQKRLQFVELRPPKSQTNFPGRRVAISMPPT